MLKYFHKFIAENRPTVCVEKPARTLPVQWILYSDLKFVADRYKVPFFTLQPTEIKKKVTGNGRATKEDMISTVSQSSLVAEGVKVDSEHIADAIACGIAHIQG